MENVERLRVLGAPVDSVSFAQALDVVCRLAKERSQTKFVVAVNPEKVMAARRDELVAKFLDDSALALPDGIGVVIASKIFYGKKLERVPGADLSQAVCAESGRRGVKIFFYGAQEDVNAGAVEELRRRYPDVLIVGRRNGYVKPEQFDALVDEINASDADILFLALGSPKQEKWMNEYGAKLNVGVCMGIGGTLDTIVGKVKRAPKAWQKFHLEWFYRLARQPSRFWRQRNVFIFAFKVLCAKAFGRVG